MISCPFKLFILAPFTWARKQQLYTEVREEKDNGSVNDFFPLEMSSDNKI